MSTPSLVLETSLVFPASKNYLFIYDNCLKKSSEKQVEKHLENSTNLIHIDLLPKLGAKGNGYQHRFQNIISFNH